LKVKHLKVFGHSEIIVKQVRNTIHCLSSHLINYQHLIREFSENFSAFKICLLPHSQNVDVDILPNVSSKVVPLDTLHPNAFSIELIFRPLVHDSITNWHVFDDDKKIMTSFHMEDTFKDFILDEDRHEKLLNSFT